MERKDIWAETARRIVAHWKARTQHVAVTYPVLFVLAVAVKFLLWSVPATLVRLVVGQIRSRRAARELATVSSIEDARRAA